MGWGALGKAGKVRVGSLYYWYGFGYCIVELYIYFVWHETTGFVVIECKLYRISLIIFKGT